jgi:hypothetical protein
MKRTVKILSLALILALGLAGCAKAPEGDVQAAQKALDEARDAGAQSFALDFYSQAENSLMQAKAEIAGQSKKFPLLRNYKKAGEWLAKAKNEAAQAQQEAAAGKARAKNAVSEMVKQAKTSLDEVNSAVAKLPVSKKIEKEVNNLKTRLAPLAEQLQRAETAMQQDELIVARNLASEIDRQTRLIQNEVTQVTAKAATAVKGKRK